MIDLTKVSLLWLQGIAPQKARKQRKRLWTGMVSLTDIRRAPGRRPPHQKVKTGIKSWCDLAIAPESPFTSDTRWQSFPSKCQQTSVECEKNEWQLSSPRSAAWAPQLSGHESTQIADRVSHGGGVLMDTALLERPGGFSKWEKPRH